MLTSAVHRLIVIPARLGSSRLREKPLRLIAGEPLIRVVARQVVEWNLTSAVVVVASDDRRVLDAVESLPVETVLTSPTHSCGIERVAEVARSPSYATAGVILNAQCDLLAVPREMVRDVLARVEEGQSIATAGVPLGGDAITNRDRVKVVVDTSTGTALRFSRDVPASAAWPCAVEVLQHVGLYGCSPRALEAWVRLPAVAEEAQSGLEQLRPLAHGMSIGVVRHDGPAPISIDTEHDLLRAQERMTLVGHGSAG